MQIKKYSPPIKIGFLSTFIVFLLRLSGGLQLIELDFYDLFFRLKLKEKPEERIVLVAIEHEDVNKAKIYPFPDQIYADFFAQVKAQNPRVIGWNIIRDVPVPPGTEELSAILETTPNLIGVTKITNPEKFEPLPILKERNQYGDISGVNDPDGVVRKVYLYPIQNLIEKPSESTIPYLGLKLAYAYLAEEGIEDENSTINHSWLQLGKAHFPHFQGFDGGYVRDPAYGYQVLLNWRKPIHGFKEVSFFDVIEGNIPPDLFTDKIVLVGASSASNDFHVVPFQTRFGETLRGIDIISQATSQFISAALDGRALIKVVPESREWLLIAICSLLIPSIFVNSRRFTSRLLIKIILVSIGNGFLIFGISLMAFNASWWLPVVPSLLALLNSTILLILYLPVRELVEAKKHWQLLAEQRAEQLAAQESYVALGIIVDAIANQVNNSLNILINKTYSIRQTISNSLSLLSEQQLANQDSDELDKIIKENLLEVNYSSNNILKHGQNIEKLIKQILPDWAGENPPEMLSVEDILHQSLQWINSKQKEQQQFEVTNNLHYEKNLPTIPLVKDSIIIAFKNILENAYNSVVEKSQTTSPQDYLPTVDITIKKANDYLEIEIAHNGTAIGNNLKEKTTKYPMNLKTFNQRITLELIVSYWIVKGIHQGNFLIDCEQDQSTKIKILLPQNINLLPM